jgi:hypothetical protein
MKTNIIFLAVLLLSISILFFSCPPPKTMDDYFGIKMDKNEADLFKIVSYSKDKGASYQSTMNMNPNIYAYAELDVKYVRLKVVNNSDSAIPVNYNIDEFKLIKNNGESFILNKGDRETYPSIRNIGINSAVEIMLDFPSNFWQLIGTKDSFSSDPNYTEDFWKGENSLVFLKENIKYITARFGKEYLILLKPIPEKSKK